MGASDYFGSNLVLHAAQLARTNGLIRERRAAEEARLKGELSDYDLEKQAEARQTEYDRQLKTLLGEERYATLPNTGDPAAGELRRNLRELYVTDVQAGAML